MNKRILNSLVIAAVLTVTFFSCKKNDIQPAPQVTKGVYSDGVFIICEGPFAQEPGTVNFYKYGEDTVRTRVFEKENPGKIAASPSSTLQFANIIDGKLYLLSKMYGSIIKLDAPSMKYETSYYQSGSNWRSIIQLQNNSGLVSTEDGLYETDLNTLSIKNKIVSIGSGNAGEMLKANGYIFVMQNSSAKILQASNYSYLTNYSNINQGFVQTPNGKVWASTGRRLIAFNKNLDTTGIALPVNLTSRGIDHPTKLTASTKENAVFFNSYYYDAVTKQGEERIYKYIDGQPESLSKPFISIPATGAASFMIYGVARYDERRNYLVFNGIDGFGANATKNYLMIYDAATGSLVKKIFYGGDGVTVDFEKIFFPALNVFN